MLPPCPSRAPASALLAVTLVACGGALLPPTYAPPPTRTVEQEIAAVERVRHTSLATPVPVHVVDAAAFRAALDATRKGSRATSQGRVEALASAFTLVPAGRTVGEPMVRGAENALGFYSIPDRVMYVRRREAPEAELRTLAHEVEHALQAERIDLAKLSTLDIDAYLAASAVVEGDATLTAAVASAADTGHSFALAVASASRAEETLRLVDFGPAAPVVGTWLGWPYRRGTAFVADLLRAGGWAQVDAALRTPPATTEQIIHLEKYLAGEPAIPVRIPALPPGWVARAAAHGTLGELTSSVFLAQCVSDEEAREAATGWGGDAYLGFTDGATTGLLWTTAWDDEAAAIRFSSALSARAACGRTGPKPHFVMLRSGARVAFVEGPEPALAKAFATSMLDGVDAPPAPTPPAPGLVAPGRAPLPRDFVGHAAVVGGRWSDPDIGLEANVEGLRVTPEKATSLFGSAPGVAVLVTMQWGMMSPTLRAQVLADVVAAVRKGAAANASHAWDEGNEAVNLGWTAAQARHVTFADGVEVRVVFAPACDGKITFVLATSSVGFGDPAVTAQRWLASVRAPGKDSSPACRAVLGLNAHDPF
jgi:hypothetical protein